MNWNQKIKKLMTDNNITQKQLSQMTGISESSLSRNLQDGKCPRVDMIINIAKAFHVNVGYLLEDKDSNDSPFDAIATEIVRKRHMLSAEEKNRLILLLLGK